jgi:hypothetical protein
MNAGTSYKDMKDISQKLYDLKNQDQQQKTKIYRNRENQDKWDILVSKSQAKKLISNALDDYRNVIFIIHNRNY